LSHAVSAYYVSPYKRSAILTLDGAGEANTSVFWDGEENNIIQLKSIKLPHSIGQFYASITGFLGFKPQSDEYKVMGMASYGDLSLLVYLKIRRYVFMMTEHLD